MSESSRETKPTSQAGARAQTDWFKLFTTVAGLIGAVASILTALFKFGALRGPTAAPTLLPSGTPTATVVASRSPTPTLTATPAPERPAVLLEDNFSNSDSGWDTGTDADAEWGYKDGEYRIAVHAHELVAWGNTIERHDWANLVMIVEARRVEGPLDNQYGVLVRYVDRGNFYLFTVSSDGMYAVQMLRNDEWHDLVEWTESDVVRQGEATNLLRVECQGPRMRFFVNDDLLATVEDDTFRSGSVGLAAGSFAEGGVVVHFDNLLVRLLPDS